MEQLEQKLKNKLIEGFSRKEEDLDKIYLRVRSFPSRSYTKRQLIQELKNETEQGISLMESLLNLTIDLVSRDKLFIE
jgi:hypothetical protein